MSEYGEIGKRNVLKPHRPCDFPVRVWVLAPDISCTLLSI